LCSGIYCNSGSPTYRYNDFYQTSGNFYGSGTPAGVGVISGVNANGDPCDQYFNIFLNPQFATGFGSYNLTAISPCMDAGDPAFPMDPDNTPADQGANYFDQLAAGPTLAIDLIPQGLPIFIPAGGGSLTFNADIDNLTDSTVTFDVWTNLVLPSGSTYGPLILRTNLALPANASLLRTLTQNIPATAPAGYYTYQGFVGTYPINVVDNDVFNFGKVGDDAGNLGGDWTVSGWGKTPAGAGLPPQKTLTAGPNPFNPETAVGYRLPAPGLVSLRVYDTAGREVAALVNGWREAGAHEVTFDASGLPSGIYFARLTAEGTTQVQKLVLLK